MARVVSVQEKLRILHHVMKERGFTIDSEVCDLAADAMDDQAATIESLRSELAAREAEVERLRGERDEARATINEACIACNALHDNGPFGRIERVQAILSGYRQAAEAAKEADRA